MPFSLQLSSLSGPAQRRVHRLMVTAQLPRLLLHNRSLVSRGV